ncbi:MAG: GxxExxY protein [Cytophagaceae bacterium]
MENVLEQKDILTERIIGCCFKLHNEIGPGFLERIYHNGLMIALTDAGLRYETEKEFEVYFNKRKIGKFRCDLLVEEKVIVELKSISGHLPILFNHQVISYLRASKVKTGLLINFGNTSCQIKRISV